MPLAPIPPGYPGYGTDVLLTNVISFQVTLIVDPIPTIFPDMTYESAIADTPAGSKIQPRAVQIKLRIYEPKNRLTRQITITQDL